MEFLEFFVFVGMGRQRLGAGCLFANDVNLVKAKAYRANYRPIGVAPCRYGGDSRVRSWDRRDQRGVLPAAIAAAALRHRNPRRRSGFSRS